ncbi:MAG: hypothetical protein ACR2GL_02045 [Thermoleophilaceae bacterium]
MAPTQFAERAGGQTAGVTQSGGQAVFGSSTKSKAKTTPAKGKKASSGKADAAAPSAQSATGDLWDGFQPSSRSSVFAAEASSAAQGQGGAPLAAGLALGLGLTGILGASLLFGLRRRRAPARSSKAAGSDTTER